MMISQCWINHGATALAAVSHQPETAGHHRGVLLISGFSQSMCDSDFFLSRMARRLAGEGLYVLQVDPRGHGDSPGDLEAVTLDMLRTDIQSAVAYAAVQSGGPVICVGRGLIATLMAELAPDLPVNGVAGIHPYCLEPSAAAKLIHNIGPGVIDTADILTGKDFSYFADFDEDWMAFFDALGAGSRYNLIGQKIATGLFQEIKAYEALPILQKDPEARYWLIPDPGAAEGMRRWTPDLSMGPYRSLREYRENPFPRDTLWYHHATEKICSWITAI